MSVPFRERNPVTIGAISIAVILLMLIAAFNASKLPLIGGGTVYYANFTEAGGLKSGDPVRIAGVRVGQVESVELDGNRVHVGFRVTQPSEFGTKTGADIRVNTILGAMYVALTPDGPGQLPGGTTIPSDRTTSPYDVVQVFSGLAKTSSSIDTKQLATSLTTLADLTRNTPEEFRQALSGVTALSNNIADKNERIGNLLRNLDRVTKVLDARDQDIVGLMKDADVLFRALVQRRQQIHALLVSTKEISIQLTSLITKSRADLKPALENLDNVLGILNANEDNVDNSLRLLAPFYRVFANTLGNGPWFDTYIQNLPPAPNLGNGGVG